MKYLCMALFLWSLVQACQGWANGDGADHGHVGIQAAAVTVNPAAAVAGLSDRVSKARERFEAARRELVAKAALSELDVVWLADEGEPVLWGIDPQCGWCGELLKEWESWVAAGWRVGVFPLATMGAASERRLSGAWCSDDRALAMVLVHEDADGELHGKSCAEGLEAIDAGRRVAELTGVRGTPLLVFGDGSAEAGYRAPTPP